MRPQATKTPSKTASLVEIILTLTCLLPACSDAAASGGTIATVAGNGSSGFSGDGGQATNTSLSNPQAVALDKAGNLFIADTFNYRIRRVDAVSGIITTIAGNGVQALSGDGGPATNASLFAPSGLALDTEGNIFIAEWFGSRVRRVDATTHIITTVAGGGNGDDGGQATNAALASAYGLALDTSGNLLIADVSHHRIRRVDATNGIITTVAGNGTSGFSGDGGLATSASLSFPVDVVLDSAGNLFIADQGNRRVRRVDTATRTITTLAGNGSAGFSGDGGQATNATF